MQDLYKSHVCGGVLVDPLHIVTAGHCHQGQRPIVMRNCSTLLKYFVVLNSKYLFWFTEGLYSWR